MAHGYESREKDPSYSLAVSFSDNFKPSDNRDYKWALDYSVKEYEQASLRSDALDDKADTLIGYLGAGSTFVALGLAYGLGKGNQAVLFAAVPALLLLLTAIILALVARIPSKLPALPYTKDALEMKAGTDQIAIGKFAACVWTSSHSVSISTIKKAMLVRSAYCCFAVGIMWIVLCSIVSSFIH
jgi:hypothetical protein